MESNETPLEVAQRRVAEAQAHVNAQLARSSAASDRPACRFSIENQGLDMR
jgi:hypothetical protein